jgi:hypothetical protein
MLGTIGESDPGAAGDDRIPMAVQKRRLIASAPSAIRRVRLPLRDWLRSRPSSATERSPSSSKAGASAGQPLRAPLLREQKRAQLHAVADRANDDVAAHRRIGNPASLRPSAAISAAHATRFRSRRRHCQSGTTRAPRPAATETMPLRLGLCCTLEHDHRVGGDDELKRPAT